MSKIAGDLAVFLALEDDGGLVVDLPSSKKSMQFGRVENNTALLLDEVWVVDVDECDISAGVRVAHLALPRQDITDESLVSATNIRHWTSLATQIQKDPQLTFHNQG